MPLYPQQASKNEIEPGNAGLKTWTGDPTLYTNTSIVGTAGTLYITKLYNQTYAPMLISNTHMFINTAGATLANVGFALYSAAGVLLGTPSINANGATAAAFQATGEVIVTFTTPQTIAARTSFYVGFWFTGTTMPTFQRGAGLAGFNNINLAAPNLRYATTSNTGLTTTAPATLGTQSALNVSWWVAAG